MSNLISFTDITFSSREKIILHPITGQVKPGEILAVMGPSGSGKSTLLNIIANRLEKSSGKVCINGTPINQEIAKKFGYVLQHDVIHANLTVRETLYFILRLRHGISYCPLKIKNRVDEVVLDLGLSGCIDTRVGCSFKRGLSGGERKRVAIAIELLKEQSSVLILDEPTSGLDSATAFQILSTIRHLATTRKLSVMLTIHQPQSNIFKLFDTVLLLSKRFCIYLGPAKSVMSYFEDLGYPSKQHHLNPSDHILDIVSMDSKNTLSEENSLKRILSLAEIFQNSSLKNTNDQNVINNVNLLQFSKTPTVTRYASFSPWTNLLCCVSRFLILSKRNFIDQFRAPIPSGLRIMQGLFFALILSAFYFQLGNSQKSVFDRQGFLFFTSLQQCLAGICVVVNTFHTDKRIFHRERAQGLYGTLNYYLSKIISEIPLLISPVFIFCGIVYPLVGLNPGWDHYFIMVSCLCLCTLTAQSMGLLISAASSTPEVANTATPIVLSFLLLFGGFFVDIDHVPFYFRWIRYVNFIKYTNDILTINDFQNMPLSCDSEIYKNLGNRCPLISGNDVLNSIGLNNVSIPMSFSRLAILTVIFHFTAYFFLRYGKGFRM